MKIKSWILMLALSSLVACSSNGNGTNADKSKTSADKTDQAESPKPNTLVEKADSQVKNDPEKAAPEKDTPKEKAQEADKTTSGGESDILPDSKGQTVFAEVNGKKITEAEVAKKIEPRLSSIRNSIFEIQLKAVNSMVTEELINAEAKRRNLDPKELIKQEVDSKVGEISDEEALSFYEKNKARMRGQTFEKARSKIKRQLKSRQASSYRNSFLDRLREQAQVKIHLERPRVDVSADDDYVKGDPKAPITVIEFTDYQCPFCVRVRPTIEQILEDYKGQVNYVLRDFPLNFHAQAKKAAEAAHCAGDQDKYWEYSDKLWENQKALHIDKLKEYAKSFNLDQAAFDKCLDSGKYAQEVSKDMSDGKKAGVTGTPAFFINGQFLKGAKPYEAFKEAIDMELLRLKSKG